jgi:hypothetical protein
MPLCSASSMLIASTRAVSARRWALTTLQRSGERNNCVMALMETLALPQHKVGDRVGGLPE